MQVVRFAKNSYTLIIQTVWSRKRRTLFSRLAHSFLDVLDDSLSHAFWYSLKRALSICVALSLSLSCPPLFSFPGDEEFLFRRKRGGRLCLLHVVSTWRVDLLCGRRLCAVLLQHHYWQARENPHGTVRPHSTCCISTRSVLVGWSVIGSQLKLSSRYSRTIGIYFQNIGCNSN